MNFDHLQSWVGREERAEDVVATAPLAGLAATLDHDAPPWPPGAVPPLGHWLYFLPRARQSGIGPDGHPHRGGFLPPVDLPRRMWAAGALRFHAPIAVGATIERRSVIEAVTPKAGRSGAMVFVKVRHEISAAGAPALTEHHDIVYREAPQPGSAPPAPPPVEAGTPPLWERKLQPDPVLLFRYSALTFNGHLIHYDRGYCRDVEGYPGLIVHGPLTATLLMDIYLRHHPAATVTGYRFRAVNPLFDIHPLTLCGRPRPGGAELWALDHQGRVAMQAELDAG